MATLPIDLYSPEQVRELDRLAMAEGGIPGERLMERAGRRAWAVAQERWPQAERLAVLCGGGNNAGDGYVVARLAAQAGKRVEVLYLVEPERLGGDAAAHARRYRDGGGACRPFTAQALAEADLIVDALLGTGLDRPVAGRYAEAVAAANAAPAPVLAVDIPSGIHGRTGAELGEAVRAAATATFVGLKSGLFTGRGAACSGAVHFDDLGAGAVTAGRLPPYAERIAPKAPAAVLPPRERDAHKGRFGHVLVVGGEHGMPGAARLAAEAAARTGAGLVSVATRAEHVAAVAGARPELMVHAVAGAEGLAALLERATVVAVGPGLGRGAWGQALWAACRAWDGPKVVDADALNLLAEEGGNVPGAVLTPHPGEAARLLGGATAEVNADRFAAVRALAPVGGAAVLKGAGSVIDDGEQRSVATVGNPGMASGGMGDVLTGVIAGLLAQGLAPGEAARWGAWAHGCAGDRAAAELGGEPGLLAGDLLGRLPALLGGA